MLIVLMMMAFPMSCGMTSGLSKRKDIPQKKAVKPAIKADILAG